MDMNRGIIMINTGNGKGKSTSAFGLALRAIGHEHRVCIIQFMKGDIDTGEYRAFAQFLPQVRFEATGSTDFVDRDNPSPLDLDEADRAMLLAEEALQGDFQLVILDEINVAIDFGLVSTESVIRLLQKRAPYVSVMLTGRNAPESLRQAADMVSEITEIKHHYYSGIPAKAGIEY